MSKTKKSKILLLNPFHSGSHRQWAEGLTKHSRHQYKLLSLPGRNWKWRMHGAAVHFAEEIKKLSFRPDIILSTDMMDMSTLRGLCQSKWPSARYFTYFHENQISYPWSPTDQDVKLNRDYHYSFINYTTALASDKLFFNSEYHKESFLQGVEDMLNHFPDHIHPSTVTEIRAKSKVLYLGLEMENTEECIIANKGVSDKPILLWNHRWEYDKNPEEFFEALFELKEKNIGFKLIVSGESYQKAPAIFSSAREKLKDEIIHFGYAASRKEYLDLLSLAEILPVSNIQDFFGGSIIEAINAAVIPILPDRLAYPEHIPPDLKSTFLYAEEEGLTNALIKAIQNLDDYRHKLKEVQDWVKRYAWHEIITRYDSLLE